MDAGDLNGDGDISSNDYSLMRKYLVGLLDEEESGWFITPGTGSIEGYVGYDSNAAVRTGEKR